MTYHSKYFWDWDWDDYHWWEKPDLIVKDTPVATFGSDGSLTISATLKNIGSDTAWWSKVAAYISTDDKWSKDDRFLGDVEVGKIYEGNTYAAEGTVSKDAYSDLAPGQYYVIVVADYCNDVKEGDETNNVKTVKITIGPDLDIANTPAPTAALNADGTSLTVAYQVDNIGTTNSAASTSGLYLSTDANITTSDIWLGSDAVAAILAGKSSTEGGTFNLPAGITAGQYYLGVIADYDKKVGEVKEDNNSGATTTAITLGADLDILDTPAPTVTLNANGTSITVGYQVKNIGPTASAASTSGIYLSTSANGTSSDIKLDTDAVASLLAGKSSVEGGTYALPTLTPGTYYIRIVADDGKTVSELNENNNTAAIAFTVGPDLDVADSPVPTAALSSDGKSVTVSYQLNNIGTTASAASTSGIYLSTDSIITTDDIFVGADAVAALLAGASTTEGGTFTLPTTGLTAGQYYVGIIADYDKKVGELNEDNNTAAVSLITIGADLNIAASPAPTFTIAADGRSYTVGYQLANLGTAGAAATRTGIYLSSDSTITTGDIFLGYDDAVAIGAGQSVLEGGTFALPAGLAAGTYYVGLLADHNSAIAELNESNNASVIKQITIGADLDVVAAPTLAIAWAGSGGTFELSYRIDNLGNIATSATQTGIYLSTDATITTADRLVAVDDVAALAAKTSSTEAGTFTMPGDVAGGVYYIGVIADFANALGETNEANNPSAAIQIAVFSNNADTLTVPIAEHAWHGLGGNDTITGSAGRDALYGDADNDTLIGMAGNDTLIGGAGFDRLTGGTGIDYYQFDSAADIGTAAGFRDIITDWNAKDDYIDLRKIDAKANTVIDDAFVFAGKRTTFTGVIGQLVFFQQNLAGTVNDRTIVMGDTNGDKIADFTLELIGLHNLAKVDFLL